MGELRLAFMHIYHGVVGVGKYETVLEDWRWVSI